MARLCPAIQHQCARWPLLDSVAIALLLPAQTSFVHDKPDLATDAAPTLRLAPALQLLQQSGHALPDRDQIGRASCRERV